MHAASSLLPIVALATIHMYTMARGAITFTPAPRQMTPRRPSSARAQICESKKTQLQMPT